MTPLEKFFAILGLLLLVAWLTLWAADEQGKDKE